MPIKWLIFFFSTWFTLALIGAGVEQAFTSFETGGSHQTSISNLMVVYASMQTGDWYGVVKDFFPAVMGLMFFRFSYFEGFTGFMAMLVVFLPIMASMIVAFVFAVRGSPSS